MKRLKSLLRVLVVVKDQRGEQKLFSLKIRDANIGKLLIQGNRGNPGSL